jgi:hypothetical protein
LLPEVLNQAVILVVAANPEPNEITLVLGRQGAEV